MYKDIDDTIHNNWKPHALVFNNRELVCYIFLDDKEMFFLFSLM